MKLTHLIPAAAVVILLPAAAAETVYTRGTLPNGLTYHIIQAPESGRRLELRMQVNAGTSDEDAGEKGAAHMLEHLAFKSSPHYPEGIAAALSKNGWQTGRHFNALTSHGYTRYMLTPPRGSKQLDESLAILGEFLKTRDFKATDWQQEQKIIQGELRTLLTLKERMALQRTASFKNGSREARYRPIGDEASVNAMQAATLSAFHKKWYAPNNAVLAVISSLPAAQVKSRIEKQLGGLPKRRLPERNAAEYEPQLRQGWHIDRLQDKDNTESELNLLFRFPNAAAQSDTPQGEYQRLLDNFAAYIVNQRLQTHTLPGAVQQISLKTGNLGRQTGYTGLFARTTPSGHETALRTILKIRQNILSSPASDEETAAYRRRFSDLLRHNQNRKTLSAKPDELLRQIQETVFAGKPLRTPAEYAAAVRPALYRINSTEVNERIRQWFNAEDKLVQAQAPGLEHAVLPAENQLARLAENPSASLAAASPKNKTKRAAAKPAPSGTPAPDSFPTLTAAAGSITGGRYDAGTQTQIFELGNGDTAVILQTPVAAGRTYLKIISRTGYLQNNVIPWQVHLAGGVIWKTPPQGLSENRFAEWKNRHRIKLDYHLSPYHQTFDGSAPDSAFAKLLQLYRVYQSTPEPSGTWQSLLQTEAARRPIFRRSVPGRQESAEFNLRYGSSEYEEPSGQQIGSLGHDAIRQQWQLLNRTPVAYYIVTDDSPHKIRPLIESQLAGIPRTPALNNRLKPSSGSVVQRIPANDSRHTDVSAWSWQPFYNWTPETSEQIPLLENLANARLKAELRGRLQGTYSLKFTTRPDPEHNLVENQLYFNAEPQRAQELWQSAQKILQQMPEDISRSEAENLQRLFTEQEAQRSKRPEVWLERLATSHQKYGDARYIRDLPQLKYSIIQTRLRQTAKLLWSEPNARILLIDPK